jgi:indole-3-acetate monooxygenase
MTTTHPPTTRATVDDVRVAVDELAPNLPERAGEIESTRGLPRDLVEQLTSAGCFHQLLPTSHGGVGASPSEFYECLETLARAEPSVGWLVMIGAASWIDMAGLERATFDEVVGGGNRLAGVFAPQGTAEPVDDGVRVTGRWAFASGCGHADWIYGNCIDPSGDEPAIRTAVFRADELIVEDTWHVLGLRGTGSHHVRADAVTIPTERTCTDADPRALDVPILGIPPPSLLALALASVCLGTARGALDHAAVRASERTPLLAATSYVTNPLYLWDLAHADTELRAARALVHEAADDLWATAEAGDPVTLAQRSRARATGAWVAERARAAVDAAYRAGGGSAVYDDGPLQRRLRDMHTMTQHFLVRPDTLVTAGRAMTGQELDVPVF